MIDTALEIGISGGLAVAGSGCLGYAYDRDPLCLRWVFAGSGITALATAWLIAYRRI
jgi:hypothetical protein